MITIDKQKITNDYRDNGYSVIPYYVDCSTCEKLNKSECVEENISVNRMYNTTAIRSRICTNWHLKNDYLKIFSDRRKNETSNPYKKRQEKTR